MKIIFADLRTDSNEIYHYVGGIGSYVEFLNQNRNVLHEKPIYIDKVVDAVSKETGLKSSYLTRVHALLVLTKGEDITLKDVHDAWAMDMNFRKQTNYCYGHEHRSIVPFNELSKEVQDKDQEYVDALKRVAKRFR